jgi:hypothetical protein
MPITATRRDSTFGSALMAAKKKTPMKMKTPMKNPMTKAMAQPKPPGKLVIGGKPRGRPRKNPA